MKRIAIWIGVALLAVIAGGAVFVYQRINTLEVAKVSDDVHVIYGLGSNVGILRTSEGAVVVDTMTFRMQGREVREKAEELGGGATRAVINTHYHLDHTHGNPAFAAGLPIVSTEKTLAYLKALDAGFQVMAIPFVMRLDRSFVVKRAWQEATGNFTPVQLGGGQ